MVCSNLPKIDPDLSAGIIVLSEMSRAIGRSRQDFFVGR